MKRKDGLPRSDKGKKRTEKYDMSNRLMMKENRAMKKNIELIERLEKREARRKGATSRAEYKRIKRHELLERVLRRFKRKCPCCGRGPILENNRWVLVRKQLQLSSARLKRYPRVLCRSCYIMLTTAE
jgi:hypothetical protein